MAPLTDAGCTAAARHALVRWAATLRASSRAPLPISGDGESSKIAPIASSVVPTAVRPCIARPTHRGLSCMSGGFTLCTSGYNF